MAVLMGCFAFVSAGPLKQPVTDPAGSFSAFAQNAEGRYFTSIEDGFAVVELIPAFDRLFASVGYYMGEKSLYSYYAAELIPVCRPEDGYCEGIASDTSFDVKVRIFSNMSMAGNYWPGETVQRLTLIPGGLLLSNYSGDGDALISKESVLLKWSDEVPGIFPYGPAEAGLLSGEDIMAEIPDALTGTMAASWLQDVVETTIRLQLSRDGTILELRDQDAVLPPLLMKGGFSVSDAGDGSYRLCYLMSSPSSGMMPYSGCVSARAEADALVISRSAEEYDDLMLPDNTGELRYRRY